MNAFSGLSAGEQSALDEAAHWWERLRREPSLEISQEFLGWISVPDNARALRAVRDMMATAERFGTSPKVLNMRRAALARLKKSNFWNRFPARLAAASVAAVLLLGGGIAYYRTHVPVMYDTGIGERQAIQLSDGSRLSMDSDSQVEVLYTKAFRAVKLDHGRARFDVAHDTSRPFTVTVGGETVVAVGTSFNVEKLGPEIFVTMLQGRVVVKQGVGEPYDNGNVQAHDLIRLSAGQEMATIGSSRPLVRQADLDAATAWEKGQLVFRGEPLGKAVLRMNRYTGNPIAVAPSAAAIPISGAFRAGDIGTFVSAITDYFPVEATTDGENRITLQKRT